MKRRLKALLGLLCFRTGLYRMFFRDKAIIALFHRVDDRLGGNPISCTTTEFCDFCDFFGRYFRVVALETLLTKLRRGEDISGHLVITFDDGYRDNIENAAAELERRHLPACFFVATEFIGSTRVPAWDAELGIVSPWMSWDDVRALSERGFEIGAHTMNHVDLGIVGGEEAAREIVGSRRRLGAELGDATTLFSYPFGRVDQITPDNRAAVRDAGFTCCLSAYGGTVAPQEDPFHLKRIPVSPWFVSPYQYGFEAIVARE